MKNQLSVLIAATIMAASCSNNIETGGTDNERVALNVSGTVNVQTLAYNNTWEAGDAIGIYLAKAGGTTIAEKAENRKYTTIKNDGKFTAAHTDQTIYFPVDGSNVDCIAYYPHTMPLTDGALTLDVSTQTDLSAIDMLVAKTVSTVQKPINKENPEVALHFAHRLTKLELAIAAGVGVTTSDLAELKVEITNQRTQCSYNPLSEMFEVNQALVNNVILNTSTVGTFAQAIILPTTIDGDNPIVTGRELIFTLKTTGEVFKWDIPNDKQFDRGDKNIYNIVINRTSLDVTSTITDWNDIDGGDGNAEMQ